MRTTCFVNMKGGVAKTTLSTNIADYISRTLKKKVLLVDIDPQFNATQCLIEGSAYFDKLNEGISTVVDIFDDSARAVTSTISGMKTTQPKKFQDIVPIRINDNFFILPGNIQLYRVEMTPGQGMEFRLKRYLESIKDFFDYVIIDTPPTPSVWMSTALIASDYYAVPCKPEPLSTIGIDLLKWVVDQKKDNYGLNIKCAGIILTMSEGHTKAYQASVDRIKSDPLWKDLYCSPLRQGSN